MKPESEFINGYITGLLDANELLATLIQNVPPELKFLTPHFKDISNAIFEKAQTAKRMHNEARSS